MSTSNPVPKIYRAVIDDVIKNVRESFLNEGVDEQVLQELKQLWESKLLQSRAIDFMPTDVNVRVSLTYPHHIPTLQATSEAGPSSTASQQPSVHGGHIVNTQHAAAHPVMHNQAGQLVYVTHPTLGSMQMTRSAAGASAQATLALQDPRTGSTTLLPQNIAIAQGITSVPALSGVPSGLGLQQVQHLTGIAPPTQVIQIQANQPHTGASSQAGLYPTFQTSRGGPRVIFTQQPAQGQVKQQVIQVDGANDSSSEDDLDDDDYDNYPMPAAGPSVSDDQDDAGEEEEPLNSEDDVSEEDPTDFFDTDNVVVCQYDKIARTRNRWKFHLKDGIMNLKSKDYVFHKANGDSEW